MTLPVVIERTRNRSSRAIVKDDHIVIRLAGRMTKALEREHIEVLTRRISKSYIRDQARKRIDPFGPLLRGEVNNVTVECVTGTRYEFSVREGLKTKGELSGNAWTLTRGRQMSEKSFHRFLWKLLTISAEVDIAGLVRRINNETLRLPVRSVTLKYMKSRWGSCSHTGAVALSTPLLCTSPAILRYVILHELAHIREMNHSRKFWHLVEQHCPEYRERVKELKKMKMARV